MKYKLDGCENMLRTSVLVLKNIYWVYCGGLKKKPTRWQRQNGRSLSAEPVNYILTRSVSPHVSWNVSSVLLNTVCRQRVPTWRLDWSQSHRLSCEEQRNKFLLTQLFYINTNKLLSIAVRMSPPHPLLMSMQNHVALHRRLSYGKNSFTHNTS